MQTLLILAIISLILFMYGYYTNSVRLQKLSLIPILYFIMLHIIFYFIPKNRPLYVVITIVTVILFYNIYNEYIKNRNF
jgi:hypothetical protein